MARHRSHSPRLLLWGFPHTSRERCHAAPGSRVGPHHASKHRYFRPVGYVGYVGDLVLRVPRVGLRAAVCGRTVAIEAMRAATEATEATEATVAATQAMQAVGVARLRRQQRQSPPLLYSGGGGDSTHRLLRWRSTVDGGTTVVMLEVPCSARPRGES